MIIIILNEEWERVQSLKIRSLSNEANVSPLCKRMLRECYYYTMREIF